MANTGETVDDQGSGWFLVKKKQRSSSKFSVQSWVGGFSGKPASNNRHNQPSLNEKVGNLNGKLRSQPPKAGGNSVVQGQSASTSPIPVSSEDRVVHYDDKRVLEQDRDCQPSAQSHIGNSTDQGDIKKPSLEVRHDVTQKIMWGDLEDEIVVPHHERDVGAEIRFGDIGNDNDTISPLYIHGNERSENHSMKGTTTGDGDPYQLLTSISNNPEECREVKGLSIENVEEKIVCPCNDSSICRDECSGHAEPVNIAEKDVTVENVAPLSEIDDAQITQRSDAVGSSEKTLSPRSDKHEIFEELACPDAVKDTGVSQHAMASDGIPKPQNVNASAEEDSSESKERFRQRLWCFLFENLNRAVDELYLLCELECDVEQMKEAVLVLEESASDFKELTCRVEKFENARRSSSTDGMPITLKTDHRRPHALSWEVRRMTTSPHKAEILSSSIEAFRKIQEERASIRRADDTICLGSWCSKCHQLPGHNNRKSEADKLPCTKESSTRLRRKSGSQELVQGRSSGEKGNVFPVKQKVNLGQNGRISPPNLCFSGAAAAPQTKDATASTIARKSKKEHGAEKEKHARKDKLLTEGPVEKHPRSADQLRRQNPHSEKEREKRNTNSWKCMDTWKEKRNWEDILSSPFRVSPRISHSPGLSRKSAERTRVLHDKLMSPEKKKKTAVDLKRDAEEKHARAMRIRSELENEKMQKLQRTSEKLNRVNEWQAVRNLKLREGMYARHQRSESRHEAYLAQVARRAGDESSKVNEVRFITSLNEENKKLILRQKLHDSEMRRAEKLQYMKIKQKEDSAREEAVLERRKIIEAEKLQRLVETQRKKEEAQVRREEERRASSAAREARAMEQLRRREVRAKAQQEEAELLAQKLAEKLSESEQRRKYYLEQIRERGSMDFREQSSPLLRRPINKETQGRSTPTNISEEDLGNGVNGAGGSAPAAGNGELQHSMKRRVKRIRQKLMALKHDFPEPLVGAENTSIGYRTAVGSARAKIGRWLQELQRLRQERKEGAAGIGLIAADMTKSLEGKEPELQASRQAGLLDFISSALPASHTLKPEACQVTIHLLKLLRVVLSLPANRSYFLSQNLLPSIIPMMSAALENYIKIAASLNIPGSNNMVSSKTSIENFESISEVLDGLLWTVTAIIGYASSDERQIQMREGLTELLIAYQVIHRLRDLFALYDRPQVEGSPFPSSIVFSIQLLVVLTTRPETNNVIDWDVLPVERKLMFENEAAKLSDSAHSGFSLVDNSSGHQKPEQGVGQTVKLPEKSDDSSQCESNNTNETCESVPATSREKALPVDASVQLKDDIVATRNGLACIILGEGNAKSSSQKDCRCSDENLPEKKDGSTLTLKQPMMSLLSAISETGLVCLPSLLTSVVLQANNRLSAEQASYVLPLNFEEVATGVLKFLNNLAYTNITYMQKMLARPDLKMEFFHLMGFLLSHCNTKWKSHNDQVSLLLLESLLLLSHFALFHPENQAVLRWGNSPTILHKVCDLPFVFFSDPELMPVLAGTLVAACYGSEQNRGVVQLELSVDMLLSLLKSCRNVLPYSVRSNATPDNLHSGSSEPNQMVSESKKSAVKSVRGSARNLRTSLFKGLSGGNSARTGKKKDRVGKVYEEAAALNDNLGSTVTSAVMLHYRFPSSFIDRAEKFFSEGVIGL